MSTEKKIFDLTREDLGKRVEFETSTGSEIRGELETIIHDAKYASLRINGGGHHQVTDPELTIKLD